MIQINQEHLETEISSLEKGYVTSVVELIKIPVFNKVIQDEIDDKETTEAKREELTKMIVTNETNAAWHKESLENVEAILTEVYKLRK